MNARSHFNLLSVKMQGSLKSKDLEVHFLDKFRVNNESLLEFNKSKFAFKKNKILKKLTI